MLRERFIFECDIIDGISAYPKEDRYDIIEGLVNYVRYGEIPNLKPELMGIFNVYRVKIDKDGKKYEQTCINRSKNANIRWDKYREQQSQDKG